jgi:hypothetical protein
MADLVVLSLIAVPWLVSCVVVFLRGRWFRKVLEIGAGLIALLAVVYGVLTESSDSEVPWIVVSAFVGGLLFVGWALGAIFGRELSRARERARRARESREGARTDQ